MLRSTFQFGGMCSGNVSDHPSFFENEKLICTYQVFDIFCMLIIHYMESIDELAWFKVWQIIRVKKDKEDCSVAIISEHGTDKEFKWFAFILSAYILAHWNMWRIKRFEQWTNFNLRNHKIEFSWSVSSQANTFVFQRINWT